MQKFLDFCKNTYKEFYASLTNPKEFFKTMPVEGGYKAPILYLLTLGFALGFIKFIFFAIFQASFRPDMIVMYMYYLICVAFFASVCAHPIIKLFKGERNFQPPFPVMSYACSIAILELLTVLPTPFILGIMGSIIFAAILGLVQWGWYSVITYKALKEVHNIGKNKIV